MLDFRSRWCDVDAQGNYLDNDVLNWDDATRNIPIKVKTDAFAEGNESAGESEGWTLGSQIPSSS